MGDGFMKNADISNTLKISLCYIGAVIGAGFASGQEILSFFVKYGIGGAWALVICGFLFFLYGYAALNKIYVRNIVSFSGYLEDIAGRKTATIIEAVSYCFMFSGFCVMVSGSGAVADQLFGMKTLGIIFMASFCLGVFIKGADGMIFINAIMTPLIIAGIIVISFYVLIFDSKSVFMDFNIKSVTDNFLVSAIIYVSYNTATLIGVLLPMKKNITSKRVVLWSSVLSGGGLSLMGLLLWGVMYALGAEITGVDVPMLFVAEKMGQIMKYVYAAVLYMAMITTAVSSGVAVISFLKSRFRIGNFSAATLICLASVPLAYIGFSNLVNKLYRFFGYVGLFMWFTVVFDGIREKVLTKGR